MRLPYRHSRVVLGAAALLTVRVARGNAQELAAGAHAVEIHVSARRLNGRQQPRFTPFRNSDYWILIDSVRRSDRVREDFVTLDNPRGPKGTIVTTASGTLTRIARPQRARPLPDIVPPKERQRFERASLFDDFEGPLTLPQTKLWDIVPTVHPARLAPGARWTDSLHFDAESLGNRQTLAGSRASRVVRDTTVAGKQLWIVADTAIAHYDERALQEERTLDTLVTVTRTGTATIHGRMLYDPALGLALVRDDTLTLAGTAVLRYPDGRTFSTPAHDERIRHAVLHDSASYRARRAAIRAEQERHFSGGMVAVASDPIDQRMRKGDTAARDSVLRMWRRATAPNERDQLYGRLSLWNGHDTAFARRVAEMRVADGDTAFLLDRLARAEYRDLHRGGAIDTTRMRQLIGVMANPGFLFAFGIARDPYYEDLAQSLHTYPPAAIRDTARWPCTPAACRMLAEQYPSAAEPRLRLVGLIARFVLDPRAWSDSLVAHAAENHALLSAPIMLARGVGATWPAASNRPLPPPGADWHAWTDWMNGRDTAFARAHPTPPSLAAQAESPLRFDDTHATAIRFTEARTGRDIIGELRRQLAQASSDSARLVYEYMLTNLGELQPTAESVAALLRSTSPARRTLGIQEVQKLFAGATVRADAETTDSLQDVLIATALQHHGKRWRKLEPEPSGPPDVAPPPMREAPNEQTYLLADSLSPGLRAKWAPHVRIITSADWKKRSEREGGTLFTLTSVVRVGPFARLGVESSGRIARAANQAPWLYYASTTYYLMQLDGEWVLVTMEGWIT